MAAQGVQVLLTHWLGQCEREHVGICDLRPFRIESSCGFTIKLIDIQHYCIVNAENGARYVALSYVWGDAQQLKLSQSNKELLMSVGGLRVAYGHIPATIRDCIKLCEELGERYLWVDTLCVIQDDPLDKKWQISRMGRIYAGATVTVVAAYGHDANAGLPRLHSLMNAEKSGVDKTLLSRTRDPSLDLKRVLTLSTWNGRGWTFQESVLSNRLLVFSDDQIYFKCKYGTVSEDDHDFKMKNENAREPNIAFGRNTLNTPLSSLLVDLERYTSLVAEYSSRSFTYQKDALDAFTGILESFAEWKKLNNTFTYALPIAAFDYAFCWSVEEHLPQLRRPQFPSWSWIGWAQKSSYERAGEYRFTHNIVKPTFQAVNGTWASFQSKVLGPRCWGNFSHSNSLMIETSTAMLRVSFTCSASEEKEKSSCMYSVSCPYDNSIVYGWINLDRNWREPKADEMKFIVIHVTRLGDQNVITHTLCVEEIDGKHYRVNMMDNKITMDAWEAARPWTATIYLF